MVEAAFLSPSWKYQSIGSQSHTLLVYSTAPSANSFDSCHRAARLTATGFSFVAASAIFAHRQRSRSLRYVGLQAAPRVAVIGAGPAGLAAALALRKEANLQDVTVFERSSEIRPGVGGGVQLHAGAALLESLGVQLEGWRMPLRRIKSRAVDGSVLLELNLPELVEKFSPFVGSLLLKDGSLASCTVMRDALLKAMADALPKDSIQLNMPLEDISIPPNGDTVECRFANGSTQEFDLVIAADGIKSLARRIVTNEDETPRYTGLRIQYGVREAGGRPKGSDGEAHQWFGDGVYALTASYGGIGGKTFEMVAVVFRDDRPVAENTNWNTTEVREACLERLRKSGHNREILDVAEGCTRFFELGVCERPVGISRWHRNRLVLVGDAAHAMPPFLGAGANQAIQDAVCLSRWLRQVGFTASNPPGSLLEAALLGYTAQRLPPVALLGFESGFLGQVETLPGKLGSAVRDNFFRLTAGTGVAGLVFLNGAIGRA